jgi:8-oxo-dGTP pyrophosphatase MutT (NUDIX family)
MTPAKFRPRLAARALILHQDRLLLVNAYPGARLGLWCAPGGGCEAGQSLPENLAREVHEETGLRITVGPPALVNEFHDPDSGFHQIDLFFRCTIAAAPCPTAGPTPKASSPTAASSPAPNSKAAPSASSPTACPPSPGAAKRPTTTRLRSS